MSNMKTRGRPNKKLISTRLTFSATTVEEQEFILALLKRKEANINFNVGEYVLRLAIEGSKALPASDLQLGDATIEKITDRLLEGLTQKIQDLRVISGINSLIAEGKEHIIDNQTPSNSNVMNNQISENVSETPMVDESIIQMRKGNFF